MAAKKQDWNLADFSKALEKNAEHREALRKDVEKILGEPVLFLPYEEGKKTGVGWFVMKDHFRAHRKIANGYEAHPCAVIEFELFRALQGHLPRK